MESETVVSTAGATYARWEEWLQRVAVTPHVASHPSEIACFPQRHPVPYSTLASENLAATMKTHGCVKKRPIHDATRVAGVTDSYVGCRSRPSAISSVVPPHSIPLVFLVLWTMPPVPIPSTHPRHLHRNLRQRPWEVREE